MVKFGGEGGLGERHCILEFRIEQRLPRGSECAVVMRHVLILPFKSGNALVLVESLTS